MSNKKYGLIIPGKSQQPTFQASRNVFGDDSESDEDSTQKPVLLRPSQNINRQAKILQEKAKLEDPTVYQYDEVYDSMVNKKEEVEKKVKEDKKPKYIENLLKSANKRKLENERRIERQIQKEREKEGDEFADKEVFVTSAYKKKLEEMRLDEEKEKREEYLESIGDVTKQRDLGGFYRHLYEQKLGSDKKEEQKPLIEVGQQIDDGGQTPDPTEVFRKKNPKSIDKHQGGSDTMKRNYRKRKSSHNTNRSLSEGEIDDSDDEINRVNMSEIRQGKRTKQVEENIDADSDFSIDDPSDGENQSPSYNNTKDREKPEDTLKKPGHSETPKEKKEALQKVNIESNKDNTSKEKKILDSPKSKLDIWKKRTVGEVFEQALKRYYERKAARGF